MIPLQDLVKLCKKKFPGVLGGAIVKTLEGYESELLRLRQLEKLVVEQQQRGNFSIGLREAVRDLTGTPWR